MSSTNRGGQRIAQDFYPTPAWCVHRLLEGLGYAVPGERWLDPCAGDGAIIKAVDQVSHPIKWTANDIRPECEAPLRQLTANVSISDFLANTPAPDPASRWDVLITNPPYSKAMEFVEACLPLARYVAMLLRINFLGSEARAEFWRKNPPDVYVLPNRPSFTNGGTDSTEYAWFVWPVDRNKSWGALRVLATTPKHERRPARQSAALEEVLS